MKLVRNGKSTLRISLTKEDLKALQVEPEKLDYDLPDGKRILSELFDRARKEVGFDAAKEKVYIQLYPKNDGGCELFIIKLEEERQCFSFESFEDFMEAKALFSPFDEAICYRFQNKEKFLILAPSVQIPPRLSEFGEKWKKLPSQTFLKARCHKLT